MPRILVTLSNEQDIWITENAKKNGLPKATYVGMLINQARQSLDMVDVSSRILDFMSESATDEERKEFFNRLRSK